MSDRPKGIRRKHWRCIVRIEELEYELRGPDYHQYGYMLESCKREVDIFAAWDYGLAGYSGGFLKPRYRTLFIPA